MIEILTGSHYKNAEHNDKQFSKINDLLLDDKNPFMQHFNEGLYRLDCCDGYLGIVANITNEAEDYLTYEECLKLKEYLKEYIVMESANLYVGDYFVKF